MQDTNLIESEINNIKTMNEKNNNTYIYLQKFIDIITETELNMHTNIDSTLYDLSILNNKIIENDIIFKTIQNNIN
jgi:hypothetical protein